MAELDLEDLCRVAREGDQAAKERLFALLSARFRLFTQLKIAESSDAEEVVQEALMTVLEKYKDIDFHTSFVSWAHNVLRNKMLGYIKTKSNRRGKLRQMAESVRGGGPNSPDPTFQMRLLDCLKKVNAANRRHARILNLSYQGYRTEEICQKLDLTRTNFYSVLSRARSMLEICLEKGDIK